MLRFTFRPLRPSSVLAVLSLAAAVSPSRAEVSKDPLAEAKVESGRPFGESLGPKSGGVPDESAAPGPQPCAAADHLAAAEAPDVYPKHPYLDRISFIEAPTPAGHFCNALTAPLGAIKGWARWTRDAEEWGMENANDSGAFFLAVLLIGAV